MAALAGMGHFFMQWVLCKKFGCGEITEGLADAALSGFLAVKFVQRCAIVISYDGVFLCNYVWAKSPPPVRLIFSTLPVSSWT